MLWSDENHHWLFLDRTQNISNDNFGEENYLEMFQA